MSWGDPWSRAFEGVGRAFGNYYDNKARLQEKEEDRIYFEEAEKRKEAAAEKARIAREKAERAAGIVFEGFSPTGELTTFTRGQMQGGLTLPKWEVDKRRKAELDAKAEADFRVKERDARLSAMEATTASARANAEASRAQIPQQGLSRGSNTALERKALDAAESLLSQKKTPEEVYSIISGAFGEDVANSILPGRGQAKDNAARSMVSTAARAGQGLARLFGAQPNKDDERAASILVK